MITETLTVQRGETDKYGNRETTDTHSVQGVIAWGTYTRRDGVRGESATGDAELYAAKGVDLRPRDRVTRANGQKFAVVAGPLWDQPHPLTGHDYRLCVFTLETVNG